MAYLKSTTIGGKLNVIGTLETNAVTMGSTTVTGIATSITNDATKLATSKAVYDYVQNNAGTMSSSANGATVTTKVTKGGWFAKDTTSSATVANCGALSLALTDKGGTTVTVGSENTNSSGSGFFPITAKLSGNVSTASAGWLTTGNKSVPETSVVVGRIAKGSATTPTNSTALSSSNTSLSGTTLTVQASVTPTVTGGYITSGTAGTVKISGTVPTETKTVTPSTSAQTISPTSGKLISSITVNAVSGGAYSASSSNSITAPKVEVSGAATGFTASSAATGYYVTVSGTPTDGSVTSTATAKVTTAGYLATGSKTGTDTDKITPTVNGSGGKIYIPTGTITTGTTDQTKYVQNTAAAVPSGGYLYIGEGFYPNTQISLATLIPDSNSTDVAAGHLRSGYEAFNTSGERIVGTMADWTPSDTYYTATNTGLGVVTGYTYVNSATKYIKTVAGSAASVNGTATYDTLTGLTLSTSDKSSGITFRPKATGVSRRYTVSTAGWIGTGTYGATDGTLTGTTQYITGVTVPKDKTLASVSLTGGSSSSARTHLSSLSVPGYTTVDSITMSGIIETIQNDAGIITTLTTTDTTSGNRITNLTGLTNITNNGTSSKASTLNITTNTYGIVNVWGAGGDKQVQVSNHTVKVDGTTVTNSSGDLKPATIDVSDLTITPNALSGSWDSTNKKYVVSQASKTATMSSIVTTAGWISSDIGTKGTGTATVSAPTSWEIAAASFSTASGSASFTESTDAITGNTNISGSAAISTTAPAANAGKYFYKFTTTGSATPKSNTAGYVPASTNTASATVSGTGYITINKATISNGFITAAGYIPDDNQSAYSTNYNSTDDCVDILFSN